MKVSAVRSSIQHLVSSIQYYFLTVYNHKMSKNIYSADYIARELATVTEMKDTYTLLKQLGHEYDRDTYMTYLEDMIPKGYKQIVILEGDQYIGVAGFWLSTKLFCGPY